jgi:hypothetical protein
MLVPIENFVDNTRKQVGVSNMKKEDLERFVDKELWMHDTSEILESGIIDEAIKGHEFEMTQLRQESQIIISELRLKIDELEGRSCEGCEYRFNVMEAKI